VRRALALALAGTALAAGPAAAQAPGWQPDVDAARAYAGERNGTIAFAVRTADRSWGWRGGRRFHSASVLKAMLLVAYLRQKAVRDRPLRAGERRLLEPMIRRSANDPASALVTRLGARRLSRFARRAGMTRFTPVTRIWGHSLITAQDQARFFLRIDRLVPPRHRAYAMDLLARIVPKQRWGIARVSPPGWQLYFKGGWGTATGLIDNQVALLTRGGERVSVAILAARNGSHAHGKQTLEGVARRLLRGL
jgi:hypothetical protein